MEGQRTTDLPGEELPREKFLRYGKESLSDQDLVAILLRTGTKGKDVMEVSSEIIQMSKGNLRELTNLEIEDLQSIPGMGRVKAITMLAAIELGRRIGESPRLNVNQIKKPSDVRDLMSDLAGKSEEEVHAVYLDADNRVICRKLISKGGLNWSAVDFKVVFIHALRCCANSFILVHNHPSGNLMPSGKDKTLTEQINEAGKLLQINMQDHVIIGLSATGETDYYSFIERGMM